jgi:hypothetical protein
MNKSEKNKNCEFMKHGDVPDPTQHHLTMEDSPFEIHPQMFLLSTKTWSCHLPSGNLT